MALKRSEFRKILKDSEMPEDEKIGALMDLAHSEADTLKDSIDELNEKLDKANEELEEAKKGASGDDSGWKKKYEDEKAAFDKFKEDQTKKDSRQAKENAYKKLLEDANVNSRAVDGVLKITNFDEIELDEKGQIKDSDKFKKQIESDWAGFIEKSSTKGADTKKPPANSGGTGTYTSREEARKDVKSSAEMARRIRENPSLYIKNDSGD